jgi:hypothetical protein
VISLVSVLVLGFVLATSFRDQARNRGLAQGRAEGVLVGETAVAPLLGDRPVHGRLTPEEMAGLRRLTARTVASGEVLRLRIRDLDAHVVVSDDNSGFAAPADDEALDAAHGASSRSSPASTPTPTTRGESGPQASRSTCRSPIR